MNRPVVILAALLLVFVALAALSLVILLGNRDWNALARPEGVILTFEVDRELTFEEEPVDIEQVVAAVDRRLNPGWTRLARVRQTGPELIEVATFTTDPAELGRIGRRIQSVGTIEFRVLANRRDHQILIERALKEESRTLQEADGRLLAWWVPVAAGEEDNLGQCPEAAARTVSDNGGERMEILVVKDPFDVNGSYLVRAARGVDASGRPCVRFQLNHRGGQLFGGLTGNNLPDAATGFSRKLGILLDGFLVSAPAIRSTISGRGEITGSFSQQEVDDLVDVLNAGSLPAPLKKVGERLPDVGQ